MTIWYLWRAPETFWPPITRPLSLFWWEERWWLSLPGDRRDWIRVVSRSQSGYVLTADAGDIQVSGQDLRTLFGLRSSCFTVSYTLDTFTFTVKGYGHGVGLSQYGADYMARQGSGFREILAHYYSGTELVQSAR